MEIGHELDHGLLLDADDHATVTQPLGDADAPLGRDLANEAPHDVVTARAVARLDKLLPWTAPLAKRGGRVLALKGEKAAAEIDSARKMFRKYRVTGAQLHELTSPLDGELTRVVELPIAR